jgi:hypothetical protein
MVGDPEAPPPGAEGAPAGGVTVLAELDANPRPPLLTQGQSKRIADLSPSAAELDAVAAACAEAPAIPEGSPWPGLLCDVHVHTSSSNDVGPYALALLREMNASGVERVVVQPDHSPEMLANARLLQATRELEGAWGLVGRGCPRVVPLVYAFDPAEASSVDYVRQRLDSGDFGGVGEIEFLHDRMGIRKDPESPVMSQIYEMLGERGMTMHFQAGVSAEDPLARRIVALVAAHPRVRWVWFGGDACFASDLPENLYCNSFAHSRARLPHGAGLLRSIVGSDAGPRGFVAASAGHLPYENLGTAAAQARVVLAGLPSDLAQRVARGNFDAAFPRRAGPSAAPGKGGLAAEPRP